MKKCLNAVAVLLFLYVQQFQLTYSATVGIKNNLTIALPWVILNVLMISMPFLAALLILKKAKWAMLFNIVLVTLLSVANYHVLLFHGRPFLASDIFSIPTAMNVLSEYDIVLDHIVIRLVAIFAAEIVLWFLVYDVLQKKTKPQSIKRMASLALLALNIGSIAVLFFSPYAIFKKSLITWSWGPAMNQYGYGVCFLNSIYAISNFYSEPEGYDVNRIICENSDNSGMVSEENLPDIVLILNETLADLDVYLDVEESRKMFSKLESVEGMIHGYTVSSLIGGGTNNSEYELLTSNSMQVLNVSAPFLSLNMGETASIVSYLNDLNYTTAGMHCGNATNYNRHNAYAQMGFDQIKLGKADFEYYNKNGNRPWLDSDNYRDMLNLYEDSGDSPRFMYLLTYQNHGGYEQNDANEDTVLVKGDYAGYTDDINEYLSSIDRSINAFIELIQYFDESERDVIVMMLGDHAPAFIADLVSDKGLTGVQQDIAKKTVPYYVWSNTDIDASVFPDYASMVDLVPLMLKAAGMPLTGYYKTIVDLNEKVPIRTSTGFYMDTNGKIGELTAEYEYYDAVQNYYFMEYNNLIRADDYHPDWFEVE